MKFVLLLNLWFLLILVMSDTVQALQLCNGQYWCRTGHCCGNGKCCTYYYEEWWFWVIWVITALIGLCCYMYRKKRFRSWLVDGSETVPNATQSRDTTDISEEPSTQLTNDIPQELPPLGYDPDKYFRLPPYDAIKNLPKDPPPYSQLYFTTSGETSTTIPLEGTSAQCNIGVIGQTIGDQGEASHEDNSNMLRQEPTSSLSTSRDTTSACSQHSCHIPHQVLDQHIDDRETAGLLSNAEEPSCSHPVL